MRKIIFIGECAFDIIVPSTSTNDEVSARMIPGGRLLNASMILGDKGHKVTFMGEVGRDFAGDMLIEILERHQIEVKSIDRYTGGSTSINLIPSSNYLSAICFRDYPEENFDDIWPLLDPDDIVVFGSYFSINPRCRKRLKEFLNYAIERKTIIVYVPGFLPGQSKRITHEKPLILENLELADMVVTRSEDLQTIFNCEDDAAAYHNHIDFYCQPFINFDAKTGKVNFFYCNEKVSLNVGSKINQLSMSSHLLASIIDNLVESGLVKEDLEKITVTEMNRLLANVTIN